MEGAFSAQPSRRGFMMSTAGAAGMAWAGGTQAAGGETIVEIAQGKLRGYRNGDIHVFKGIPYGAPPTGAARFLAPQPAGPWPGVREAVDYGPSSPQFQVPNNYAKNLPADVPPMTRFLGWGTDETQGEDCLVLNVWTPGLADGKKRPVMFRIHGGGFVVGSGSWPQSDGTNVARRGDVVVVTVNHRLGPLGYLYLAELGGERYADSGNAGMLDLVLALRWVRDNITQFGGDPGNVTIFGESGGGFKVSTLLAMPGAAGLFHRAIVESGPGLKGRTPEQATAGARQTLERLGLTPQQLDRLHELPAKSFILPLIPVGPMVDGRSLLAHPGDALAAGASKTVPLIIGSNQTESTLLGHLTELPAVAALDDAGLHTRLTPLLKDKADKVIAGYRRAWPKASPGDLLLLIEADHLMRINSIRLAERKLAGSTAPVFMYLFDWSGNGLGGRFKSAHGLEVPFTMDNVDVALALSETPSSRPLAAAMSSAWIAFARTGDPNAKGLPHWPKYDTQKRATMLLDDHSRVVDDPFGDRAIWDDVPTMAF
jgi:para-nitrobenzyl esterase